MKHPATHMGDARSTGYRLIGSTAVGKRFLTAVLAIALVATAFASVLVGSYSMTPAQVLQTVCAFFQGTPSPDIDGQAVTVLFTIRIPRIILAMTVGAALAISGAAYQGVFRNPMVSPDILGVSSAASVGVALGLILGWPTLAVHALSFVFGIAAVALVLSIARAVGGRSGNTTIVMVLAGVVIGSMGSAVLSLIKYVADPDNVLPAITYWLMGSFARSGNAANIVFMLVVLIIGAGVLILARWKLNAMTFGDEEAQSLGVNVRATRTAIIAASTLMTSASVCLCGVIGWVGLIIPHIVRLMVGPNYRSLFPISLLTGAIFMLVVDDCARTIVPGELPVGVLTALIGAPFFIALLFKSRGQYL